MENEERRKYMIKIENPEYMRVLEKFIENEGMRKYMRVDPSRLSCLLAKVRWYLSIFRPWDLIGISFSLRRQFLFSIWFGYMRITIIVLSDCYGTILCKLFEGVKNTSGNLLN